ncbi:MAG: TolC family protein [Prevotellaceae bacterium]|jgi:outer membrane protein|nr:TolC family protein [Prevotellaceae bacterium]
MILLSTFFLSAIAINAQKQWTLQECIQYALDNNLNIKQQSLTIERDKNQLEQSKWAMAPSVGFNADYSFGWGRSLNQQDFTITKNKLTQIGSTSIGAGIDLFKGLQKVNTIKSNQAQLEISGQEVEQLKNDISIEIARTYLNVLLYQEVLETAKLSRQSVTEQVNRTQKLVDAGTLAHSSLLEMQAQLATEQVQVVNAENQVRTFSLSLIQLLDLSNESDFSVVVPQIQVDTVGYMGASVEQLYQASQILPKIQIGEYTLEQRERQLAVAKGQRFPSISLSTGVRSSYNPDTKVAKNGDTIIDLDNPLDMPPIELRSSSLFEQLNSNKNPYIALSFSIPILSGRTIATNIRNARLGVQQAQIDMRNRQQLLYKEIQQANNDAISAFERYKATLHNVTSMEESFRYVQQKLDVGMLNGTDFTVAKTNLFRAQSDNLQAKYQYVFQLKILDFYKGIPISL